MSRADERREGIADGLPPIGRTENALNTVGGKNTVKHDPRCAAALQRIRRVSNRLPGGVLPAQHFIIGNGPSSVQRRSDLPGAVVRSLAAIVAYKADELPIPFGLNERILELTLGTVKAKEAKASWSSRFGEWVRGLRFPVAVPQFAPVALMMMFAFLTVSQTVSADGSLGDVYSKSVQLAEMTYRQSADAWNGKAVEKQEKFCSRLRDELCRQRGREIVYELCLPHSKCCGRAV